MQNTTFYDGSLKNAFGLLSQDRSKLQTKPFLDFISLGDSRPDMTELSRKLDVARTALYQKELRLSKTDIQERILPFVAAADLAVEIFKDLERAREWMLAPNQHFFGLSPFQVAMRKEGRVVCELLLKWLGKESGQAY